jgi:hypothetical protein
MPEWWDDLPDYNTDDLTEFDTSELRPLHGFDDGPDLDDQRQDKVKGLDTDIAFRSYRRNTYLDCLAIKHARDHIHRLPEPGEAIHMVVSGRYPLFAIIPAVLDLATPATIAELHLVTLSYSKDNAADLLAMIDAKQIDRTWLLVSHYFAHANPHLFEPLATALLERGDHVVAMRTHAKIILILLSDGTKYVIHASANLRSCKNIEQCCFECDGQLYDFHHQWVAGLFDKAAELKVNEDIAKEIDQSNHTDAGKTGITETTHR